jgi:hypothetical protein
VVQGWLTTVGLEPATRPQQLSPEAFVRLFAAAKLG